MSQWKPQQVLDIVRLLLDVTQPNSHGAVEIGTTGLLEALSLKLQASDWCYLRGEIVNRDQDIQFQWNRNIGSICKDADGNPCLDRVLEARLKEATVSRLASLENNESLPTCIAVQREEAGQGTTHVLAAIQLLEHDQCEMIAFRRAGEARRFTPHEQAVVSLVAALLGTTLKLDMDDRWIDPSPAVEALSLTPRQREVLARLMLGESSKQIADVLGLSHYTVNDYIKVLYRRFGVSRRAELMSLLHRSPDATLFASAAD